PFAQSTEAKTIAQGLYDELSGEYVSADATAEGNPKIRPGKVVKLSDMGDYSGTYYVTETRHLFHERIYTTEFSVRGLRGGDLLQTLSPPTRLQPGQTCLVGIVADNNDPKGWGRVRVKFPTLTEDHMSYWARVVSAGAGASRGLDCLPEINDEVLVAFEHGDIHRPYIVGGVWNGSDAPPEKPEKSVADGKVRLRTFKTRTGHSLQFIEEDKDSSKKGVYVDTVYGHQVDLNDSEKKSQIKTKEGHYILFDDSNKKIEIKTNGGHKILLDEGSSKIDVISKGSINVKSGSSGNSENIAINGGNITLKGSTGITLQVGSTSIKLTSTGVTISGATISVKATGINTISGSMVKLN
ncbi:MAG: phage baseplate assembly protein V, partial [Cyanobacteria bacterium P01_D01_bin.2]